jgi:iron complex transport system substrate-binding protein
MGLMPDYTPRRVLSLQPSATLILAELGMLGRIVACTRYCIEVCPEVKGVNPAIVADSWTIKTPAIAAAKPDVVIASVPYQEQSVAEILRAGIPFLALAPHSLDNIYRDIAAIAGIMGVPEKGKEIITRMQSEIEAIRSQSQAASRLRVYCEEWGKPLIASQPWVAELVEAAGGEFVAAPGKQISAEAVAALEPELIIASWCGAGDRVPLEKIVRDRGWGDLPAVRHGRVACIADELLNTPAPSLIKGLHALSAAIHPEKYPQPKGLRWISDAPKAQTADSVQID